MAKSESIRKVQTIIANAPLAEIRDTAKTINEFIPPPVNLVINIIILIIDLLSKLQPVASSAVGKAADITSNLETTSQDRAREVFDAMFEIAMADGEITDEEKEFLRPRAIAAGIEEDTFELMVINKINYKKSLPENN